MEGDSLSRCFQGLPCAGPTQMFQMMVNKQTRQLRIAPHILFAPPHVLGHPAVRPDVPPEGSWLHHCEAVPAWVWVVKHGHLIGMKRAALVARRCVFFLSLKLEKSHQSRDKAVTPTSRVSSPRTSSLAQSPARTPHLCGHLLFFRMPHQA